MNRLGDNIIPALILNPSLGPEDVLRVILEHLGMSSDRMEGKTKDRLLRVFNTYLLRKAEQNITTVVIVDEAQDLPAESMEELRLLTNLETEKSKLLHIILLGQLQLEQKAGLAGSEAAAPKDYRPLPPVAPLQGRHHCLREPSAAEAGPGNAVFTDRFLKRLHKSAADIREPSTACVSVQ